MVRKLIVSSLLSLLSLLVLAVSSPWAARSHADEAAEAVKAEVAKVVEAAYVHGAFNEQNTQAMRQGFHPIFKIHGLRDGQLSTYPIDEWIANIEKRKASADYQQQTWEHRFPLIDVTGDVAIVKIELYRVTGEESKHVYTDYLSLIKFADGWKITDKVYHQHR